MRTLATTFSGGGGFEAGAVLAGLTPIWGVEYDAEIAGVFARNHGPHCIVSKVEDVDYSTLQTPYHYHTSPSCVRASQANQERGETAEDIAAAEGVARSIRILRSPNFSLENVWAYREFESFKIICRALKESGYSFKFWHLNSADYGVPQTRKRLILLASRTHRPQKPAATHSQFGAGAQQSLFGGEPVQKWVGWYEAIEDLIDTLPESKFAEWQLKRLPEAVARGVLIDSKNAGQEFGKLHRLDAEPAFTSTAIDRPSHMPRAFVVEGTAAGEDNKFNLPVRLADEPIFTVRGTNPRRAFIVDGFNSSHEDITRDESAPFFTLTANKGSGRLNPIRAFLIGGANTSETQAAEGVGVSSVDEPTRCVNASNSAHWRAWLQHGRVVSMTPRALARFQSIPDSYVLPEKSGLACKVIGNAVPSLLAQRIAESLSGAARLNTEAA